MNNILLTGASGFIGNHLINSGSIYSAVVRSDIATSHLPISRIHKIEALDSFTNWDGAFNNIDVVIHLAGLAHSPYSNSSDYCRVNYDGTLHLAREASRAQVKRFVFVSSIGVNGSSTNELSFSTSSVVNPHSAYAQSKYDAEVGLKKIAEETGLEVVIVRPTLVYGPNAPGNFGALTRLVNKVPLLPFGLAKNKLDFISVQNLADLLMTCAKHPNAGGHTFLASESETVSINEFTNAIAKGLVTKLIQLPVPVSLMLFAGKLLGKTSLVEQLIGNLEVDSTNLKKVLDWTPPYTMEESMAFLKKEK